MQLLGSDNDKGTLVLFNFLFTSILRFCSENLYKSRNLNLPVLIPKCVKCCIFVA